MCEQLVVRTCGGLAAYFPQIECESVEMEIVKFGRNFGLRLRV